MVSLGRKGLLQTKLKTLCYDDDAMLNRFTPIGVVWSRIKGISGRSSSVPLPVIKMGGRNMGPTAVATEIGRALYRRCGEECQDQAFTRHRSRRIASGVHFSISDVFGYNDTFTMSELKSAISSLKCVTEGPDLVHNEMLHHLPPAAALNALLQLFNLL